MHKKDWTPQQNRATPDRVALIESDEITRRTVSGYLFDVAGQIPDASEDRFNFPARTGQNYALQSSLLSIAEQLAATMPFSLTSDVADSPDASYHLTVAIDPANKAHYTIHLTTPATDYGPTVILAPATGARNVIQPTADARPLTVKRFNSSATSNLFEAQDQTGTLLTAIDKTGRVGIGVVPATALHVQTTVNRDGLRLTNNGSGTTDFKFAVSNDTDAQTRGRLFLQGSIDGNALADLMTVKYDGTIGIGTLTPTALLELSRAGDTAFTGATKGHLVLTSTNDTANKYVNIDFRASGVTYTSAGKPAARIGAQFNADGSYLFLGTSSAYASGITNTALSINPSGLITLTPTDAATNGITSTLILDHLTTATPAVGFGTRQLFKGKSSVQSRELVDIAGLFKVVTDSLYEGSGLIRAYYMLSAVPTARNAIGWGADGIGSRFGVHDKAAAPPLQPVLATGASRTVDDVITFLQNVGLAKQS